MNQKGISSILIILIIVGILALAAGGIYYFKTKMWCTEEGSGIAQSAGVITKWYWPKECCIGLNEIKNARIFDENCNRNGLVGAPVFVCTKCGNGECGKGETKCNCSEDCAEPNETADWKTYRNEKYGFEVKYPAKYFLLESPSHVEFSKDQSGAGMGYNPTSLGWTENPEQLSPEEWLEKYKERFTAPSSSIFDAQNKETNLGRAVIFRLVPPGNRYALIEKPQSKIIIQVSEGEKDSFEMILDSIKSF